MAQQDGVLSQEYRELRTKAKNLFKSGAVPDSFKHIEEVLITFAKTRAAENEEAWFEVMDALILQARFQYIYKLGASHFECFVSIGCSV